MNRARIAAMACLLLTWTLAACSTAEDRLVLPWFKIRISVSPKIGGLADRVQSTEYFVKRWGLWRQIGDTGVGSATALNAQTVAYYDNGQARLIHEGESDGASVCGPGPAGASFPAGAGAVDCVEVVAGPARAVATTVRLRRVNASGSVLIDKTVAVEAPGRVFLQPMVTFYDDSATPYLVAMNEDYTGPRDCALVAVTADAVTFTAGPPALGGADCSEAASWAPLVNRTLRRRDR